MLTRLPATLLLTLALVVIPCRTDFGTTGAAPPATPHSTVMDAATARPATPSAPSPTPAATSRRPLFPTRPTIPTPTQPQPPVSTLFPTRPPPAALHPTVTARPRTEWISYQPDPAYRISLPADWARAELALSGNGVTLADDTASYRSPDGAATVTIAHSFVATGWSPGFTIDAMQELMVEEYAAVIGHRDIKIQAIAPNRRRWEFAVPYDTNQHAGQAHALHVITDRHYFQVQQTIANGAAAQYDAAFVEKVSAGFQPLAP